LRDSGLTARQLEVAPAGARLRQQGNRRHAGLSEGTVKVHIAAIFRAFNVTNRTGPCWPSS
jgi:DNA-binding NarL/FixJ family response regulator